MPRSRADMILVDGAAHPQIYAMDRGLAYGDGVFRTLAARSDGPLLWRRQYAKLVHDAARLKLQVPQADVLEDEVKTVCKGHAACAVKITVTRGTGRRGYAYDGDEKPTRIVSSGPLPAEAIANRTKGVKVRLCSLRLAAQPALAGVKHLNRLENVLARAEWRDSSIAEGILCDAQGHVIAGTMSNLFIAVDGALATPGLERCGVAGLTRERVMEAAARHGTSCAVTTLSWNDVLGADEVFLVNSLAGVWPVRDLDGEPRMPGEMTRTIQDWLEQDDDA